MTDVLQRTAALAASGDVLASNAASTLITLSFVAFNLMRIVLHLPQLLTCLRDEHGCSAINLWTWSSWVAASVTNGLYMGLLLQDRWGLLLNLCNAAMCAATVVITCIKRRQRTLMLVGASS